MKKLTLLLLLVPIPPLDARQATPQSVVEKLLAADRAFSVASGKADVVNGLSAMFVEEVVMPDALNLGGPDTPTFLIGNEAIGAPTASRRGPSFLHDLAARQREGSVGLYR